MSHITVSRAEINGQITSKAVEAAAIAGVPTSLGTAYARAALVDRRMLVEALMHAHPGQGWILQYSTPKARNALEVGFESPLAPDGDAFRADNLTDVPGADFYGRLLAPLTETFRAAAVDVSEVGLDDPVKWAHAQIAAYASDEQLAQWFLARNSDAED